MGFGVLPIGDPKWVFNVMGLGPTRRDIHFDQRMLAPYVAAYGWKAYLAVSEPNGETKAAGYIAQPILVTKEGQLRHAFNFGGPSASNGLLSYGDHAYQLKEWAKREGCTEEHCTLVPNLNTEQLKLLETADIKAEFRKNSVIVDLNNQKVRGTTRRLANKAHGMGIQVMQYPSNILDSFIKIYDETMERVNAKDHWKFSKEWWEAFVRLVKPCMMMADYKGNPVAGCMVVYSQQYPVAYYHFAGCTKEFLGTGVNQQMVLAVCDHLKSINIDKLYLGGGITDANDDGLLVFKSGFSQLKLPVYVYHRNL